MKSFFKKLAFVMAMAMVISLAAPAAANAAVVLQAAEQESKEVVTDLVFVLGESEEENLCFLGAPEGWRKLERGWRVVEGQDADVVSVDNDGIVKPLKAGKTQIEFYMDGCEAAVVNVTVIDPVVAEAFDLVQKSGSALDVVFTGATNYDVKDVTLYIVYPNDAEPEKPIEIKWPIDTTKSSKKDNVITITPFVALGDGDTYKVVVGEDDDTVTTKIGTVDKITLTASKNEVYKDTDVKVTYKLFSGDIDLTEAVADNYEIEYTVEVVPGAGTEDDFLKTTSNGECVIKFFKEDVTVAVKAVVKDSKDVVYATSAPVGIASVAKPAWAFDGKVVDWALIASTDEVVDWTKKYVPADKSNAGQYSIVLKFQDSEGNTYVTQENAVRDKGADKDTHTYIDGKNDAISKACYAVHFFSANQDVMLVSEKTGQIGVYTPETGVFYIGLEDYSGDKPVTKYIYAGEIEIREATKFDGITPKKDTATVTKNVEGEDFVKKAEIEFELVDQYGDPWTGVSYAAYYYAKDNAKTEITGAFSGNKMTLTGANFAAANDTVERVYIEATSTDPLNPVKKTTSVDVTIVAPKTTTVDGVTTIVYDQEIRNDYYAKYDKVVVEDMTLDLKKVSAAGTLASEIVLYKTSNGALVGTYAAGDFETPANADEVKALTKEGTRYIVVKDPSGKFVALDDVYGFVLNTVAGDVVTLAPTGTYTVEVTTIRYNSRNGNRNDYVETATITVDNNLPTVEFASKKNATFTSDCLDGEGNVDVKDVILETMKFNYDGKEWTTMDKDDILSYKAVVLGNNVIIQYVEVKVPVGDKYIAKTIIPNVVMSVELAK